MCIMLKVDTCTTYGFLDIEANVKMLTDKQDNRQMDLSIYNPDLLIALLPKTFITCKCIHFVYLINRFI